MARRESNCCYVFGSAEGQFPDWEGLFHYDGVQCDAPELQACVWNDFSSERRMPRKNGNNAVWTKMSLSCNMGNLAVQQMDLLCRGTAHCYYHGVALFLMGEDVEEGEKLAEAEDTSSRQQYSQLTYWFCEVLLVL